jgi:hypothetical protein
VKVAGVLGLIGAMLTLAVGVYLVLISGVLSGFASALTPTQREPYGIPSIVPGVTIVACAAAALLFASVLVVGRGARPSGTVLTLAGVVACIAQAAFASGMSGSERTLFTLIQPGALVAVSGILACVKARDRQAPLSA